MTNQTPLPVGTIVDYTGSFAHGRYVITGHGIPRADVPNPETNYPDGVAYEIWPEGLPYKFGLRKMLVFQVRRTSIKEAAPPPERKTKND